MTAAYHIRMAPLSLSRLDLLVASFVQGLFPGVKIDDVVFPTASLDKQRTITLETLQRRTSKEAVDSLRAAQSLEPMSDQDYRAWIDGQQLELAVTPHKTGITGLTFKLMGPAPDNAAGQPMNAGYENIHEFILLSFLSGNTKKVTFLVEPADGIDAQFNDSDVPFSPLPFLHFHYGMTKDKKSFLSISDVNSRAEAFVTEKLEEAIRKIPGYEGMKHLGANVESMFQPLGEYTANLQHWLAGADSPITFDLQSALVPLDKGVWKLIFVAVFQIDSMYTVPLCAQKLTLSEDGTTVQMNNFYG